MATKAYTNSGPATKVASVAWAAGAATDVGQPWTSTEQASLACSVAMTGTFGGIVRMMVSNDNTNWFPMKDIYGALVQSSVAAFFEVSTAAIYIRPEYLTGVAAAVVIASFRKTQG